VNTQEKLLEREKRQVVGHLCWLAVSSIFDLLGSQKGALSLLRDENFISLNRSNGASKNPSLHMILVKSAPKKKFWPKNCFTKFTYYLSKKCTKKKSFCQKTVLPIENLLKKLVYWAKLFWGALFTTVISTFLKSVRKDGFFYTPFDLIKEKKCSSHSSISVYFCELKSPKWKQPQVFFL
jgi:hypothetical protein